MCVCVFTADTHFYIGDLARIVHFACIYPPFDEWMDMYNVFDFPQNEKFTEDNYVFIVSCCYWLLAAAAASFFFVLHSNCEYIMIITNQLFGYRRGQKTRSQMPFGSQANPRTQKINQSKLRRRASCEKYEKHARKFESNKKCDGNNSSPIRAATCLTHSRLIFIEFSLYLI